MSDYEIELYKIIGEMIREARIAKGLTLEQVAEHLDLTTKTIQRYECGERKIKIGTIIKLCELFNLEYESFMANAKAKLAGVEPSITPVYYLNDDARELAQFLFENPEYKVLFDASRKVKKEDIAFVKQMMDRMRGDVDDTGC